MLEKIGFSQNIITAEPPPAIYACSDSYYSYLSYGVNLPVHSMYWPFVAATSHVAGFSYDE